MNLILNSISLLVSDILDQFQPARFLTENKKYLGMFGVLLLYFVRSWLSEKWLNMWRVEICWGLLVDLLSARLLLMVALCLK